MDIGQQVKAIKDIVGSVGNCRFFKITVDEEGFIENFNDMDQEYHIRFPHRKLTVAAPLELAQEHLKVIK